MKILVSSHLFHPSIGGLEEVSRVLAAEFFRQGHEVKLVTQTPSNEANEFSFPVIRRPNAGELIAAIRWCDVVFHNNISLQTAWPLLLVRRPWVITHAIWTSRVDGRIGWQDRLKRLLFRRATNVSISQSIADALPVASLVLGNPFRSELFRLKPAVARTRPLVFLGRLVSDKGVDVLLRALSVLKHDGGAGALTIVGEGPEEAALRRLAADLKIEAEVTFAGRMTGEPLVDLLNAHQIMVVPSRWREPFGVVALEGIACGCVIVGSADGGLKGAIGPGGATFPNGDFNALAAVLKRLLNDRSALENHRAAGRGHLAAFHPATMARKYVAVFRAAARLSGRAATPTREGGHGVA